MSADPAYKVMVGVFGPSSIVLWGGLTGHHGVLHHDDGDHSNNALENIVPMHRACHCAHHHSLDPEKYPRWGSTRTAEEVSRGGQRLNASLTQGQRVANGRKSWETRGPKGRRVAGELVRKRCADPEYRARLSSAVSAGSTRDRRVAAAHKAWETRRARSAGRA